ncbi:MAG TPA: glycerophosphodiester phosphodiesterase family protein [Streptosporangiaceae bacterium]
MIAGAEATCWAALTGGSQAANLARITADGGIGEPIPGGVLVADAWGYIDGFWDLADTPDLYIIGATSGVIPGVQRVHLEPTDLDDQLAPLPGQIAGAAARLDAIDAATGAPGGYATLDAEGLLVAAQRPPAEGGGDGGGGPVILARVDELPNPYYVGHRGSGAFLAPEGTPESYRVGYLLGLDALEIDVFVAADGSLICMHDTTVDRTTTATGSSSEYSAAAFARLVVDAATWFGGGQPDTRPVTLREMLDQYGGRVVLLLHVHDPASTAGAITEVQRRQLDASCIFQTFDRSDALSVVAAGLHAQLLIGTEAQATAAPPAQVITDGIERVSIAGSGAVSNATISGYITAGVTTGVYDVSRQYQHANALTLGVRMVDGDDSIYARAATGRYRRTTDPWRFGAGYYHGHQTNLTSAAAVSPAERGFIGRGPIPWTTPTMLNSWTAFGSGWQAQGYRRGQDGRVYLRGVIANGAAGNAAFTIPAWVGRPPNNYNSASIASGSNPPSLCRLQISTSGDVTPQNAVGTFASIDTAFEPVDDPIKGVSVLPGSTPWLLLCGWACPLAAPTGYTFTFSARWDTLGASATRWAGAYFSALRDHPYDDTATDTLNSGYSVILRQNGSLELYRKDPGVTTQLGASVATPAITAGTDTQIRVTISGSSITVTRVDAVTPNSITATDSTYRGPYVYVGRHATSAALGPGITFHDASIT